MACYVTKIDVQPLLSPLAYKSHFHVYTETKSKVTAFYKNLFQTRWNNIHFNKLKNIKDQIGKTTLRGITLRRDEIVLHRARIGHSYITHSHLLNRENAQDCDHCQC